MRRDVLDHGLKLLRSELRRPWAWGDWLIRAVGPPSRELRHDNSRKLIDAALDELARAGEVTRSELGVSVDLGRQWREGSAAIPPELREHVRSITAARLLWQRCESVTDRHAWIERLSAEHPSGLVTVEAVRELVPPAGFEPAPPPEPEPTPGPRPARASSERNSERQKTFGVRERLLTASRALSDAVNNARHDVGEDPDELREILDGINASVTRLRTILTDKTRTAA